MTKISSKILNMVGKRFGKIVVLGISADKGLRNATRLDVKCDCGVKKSMTPENIRNKTSVYCKVGDCRARINKGATLHPLYRNWYGMMGRCYDPRHISYKYYGGRGITVSQRWHNVHHFIEDMSDLYYSGIAENKITLERINPKLNYSIDNCIFANKTDQGRNKSNSIKIEFNGIIKTRSEWCQLFGISNSTIFNRVARGVPLKDAFIKDKRFDIKKIN